MSLLSGVLTRGTWYHGRRGPAVFEPGRPIFTTTSAFGGRFYAYETGGEGAPTVYTVRVTYKRAAVLDYLMDAVAAVGAQEEDVEALGITFQTENDYLYLPAVQRQLERLGFDAFKGLDVLERSDIPILVVWRPEQVEVVTADQLPERQS